MRATQAWPPGDIPRLHSGRRQLTPESCPLTSAGALWQACTHTHTCISHPRSNTRITCVCTHTRTQTLINNFSVLKRKLLLESLFSIFFGWTLGSGSVGSYVHFVVRFLRCLEDAFPSSLHRGRKFKHILSPQCVPGHYNNQSATLPFCHSTLPPIFDHLIPFYSGVIFDVDPWTTTNRETRTLLVC